MTKPDRVGELEVGQSQWYGNWLNNTCQTQRQYVGVLESVPSAHKNPCISLSTIVRPLWVLGQLEDQNQSSETNTPLIKITYIIFLLKKIPVIELGKKALLQMSQRSL